MPPRKRGPGRPSLGDGARTNVVAVKFSERELAAIQRAVEEDGGTVAGWIRTNALASLRVADAVRIEVSPDEGDWHWVAYDADGRPLGMCGIETGPRLEARVRKAASELGVHGAENAEIVVE